MDVWGSLALLIYNMYDYGSALVLPAVPYLAWQLVTGRYIAIVTNLKGIFS